MWNVLSGRTWHVGTAIVAGLCALDGGVAGAEGIKVDDLQGIYLVAPVSGTQQKSLNQLQSGIKLLYGVVLASANNADRSTIILGKKAALQSKIITPADLKEVAIGGYVIKTAGGKIAIAGNTDACTCYGVEAFLERLGIRFYDGPAVVAFKPANRKIPTLNVADKPALIFRSTVSHALGEWAQASHALKADVTAATDQWIDHSAGYLVPKDLYYDQHPEYYAMMKNGKRIGKDAFTYHRTPLCLSNPDVTKISLERALNWVKMQPDCAFFPITYGDNPFWCACPECAKLDTRPGQYADRLLHWVNPLARAIGEKYPDKIVVTFAYSGTDEPPIKIVPEKNVYIMKAVTFAGRVCFDHDQTAMRKEFDSLERWNRVAPARVGVCTYSSGVYYPALVDFLQGMCRAYLKHHVRAVYFTYGQPATLAGLWQYVYTKLMWDPNLDAQAIAREYVMFHYNPAEKARAMLDYLALCHQRYQDTLKAGDPMDGRPYPHVLTFYSKEFADKALGCLERAGETNEMKLLVLDWMAHPDSFTLTPEATELIKHRCELLAKLAGDTEQGKAALATELGEVSGAAEKAQKGGKQVIADWLKKRHLPPPAAGKY